VKRFAVALSFVFLFALVAAANAQMGMMGGSQDWNYCPYCGQYMGQGMMGGYGGYGMGPGMMGGGMMGRGMMGGGMMGRGMMGGGMMGPGYSGMSEECQKFLDETSGLRKELFNKRFEYFEAYRNPKTSPETIVKLEKEIRELQEKMHAQGPRTYMCPW
jgi:hypothetical protein